MAEEKQHKLGRQVLSEQDLKTTVEHNGETFTLRLPLPFERAMIEAEVARRLQGFPRSSFAADHLNVVEAYVYVNELAVYDECPPWFKSAWTCLDDELIVRLYQGYLTFRDRVRDGIRSGRYQGGGKGAAP